MESTVRLTTKSAASPEQFLSRKAAATLVFPPPVARLSKTDAKGRAAVRARGDFIRSSTSRTRARW